jgi:DNA repair exonuclease SbcCD nuclease subunit
MSSVLVIGDPHLKHTNLQMSISFLRWIEFLVTTYKPDLVVNLGDTMPDHSVIRSEILNEFTKHLKTFTSTPYVIIRGNHDNFKPNDSTYHALTPFKSGYKNIYIVDTVTDLFDCTFIPFLCTDEKWPEHTNKIVFSHNTFIGADFGFKLATSGIPLEDVNCDIVISGHIHKRQILQAQTAQIIYPGTPYASSASDVDQEKGVMLFDTESYKFNYIKSPFPMWKKTNINLSVDSDYESLLKSLDKQDHHVVVVTGPRAEVKALLASKEVAIAKKNLSISFKTEFTDKVKNEKKTIKVTSTSLMVKDFISNIYTGQIDKKILEVEAMKYIGATND